MPAVVRGGRRQSSVGSARRAPARGKARNAPATPGKVSAIGRLDLSPRAVAISLAAGVALLIGVMATGARGERLSQGVGHTIDRMTVGAGFGLRRVKIEGASAEARPAIENALQLQSGQAILPIDLHAVQAQVQSVGWVKDVQVVRMLPDTLLVRVVEHDRLAVWQLDGVNRVIDGQGRVITGAEAGRYPGLPLVVGKGADEAAGAILPLLAERPRLMSRVDALIRVDERRWNLRLKDGALIQLPALDQDAALIKLDALDQRERLLDLGFSRVDLRTPEEVALRLPGDGV
ncbi:cell division protein FtsQ [Brevundimonas sp. Leaf363]|uniref:cell division protein FtsQ/DivIB n=1 Tax=Brevundimonas sp. Leaf363 TaxID=1736353 RepID=UPI0006F6DD7F|nr:cell division protein FtsQ/DivIB [Brevundimonas sp. Leaf363]KQS55514.1 cell division protein FtsQ [Brevundimonas sp. Leaf363]